MTTTLLVILALLGQAILAVIAYQASRLLARAGRRARQYITAQDVPTPDGENL